MICSLKKASAVLLSWAWGTSFARELLCDTDTAGCSHVRNVLHFTWSFAKSIACPQFKKQKLSLITYLEISGSLCTGAPAVSPWPADSLFFGFVLILFIVELANDRILTHAYQKISVSQHCLIIAGLILAAVQFCLRPFYYSMLKIEF